MNETRAVVIFGASGFIGRNLVDRLRTEGLPIFAVNRSGRPVPGAHATVALDALASLAELPRDTVAINVAADRYRASSFAADQTAILSANCLIADRFYRFCLERGLGEVRLASSQAVYPATDGLLDDERPIDLNAPVHEGEMAYAWSKRWAEILAEIYHRKHGIATLTFRLTNPFGPYDSLDEREAHVATAFVIRALASSGAFEVRGDLEARRDFVFAGDVAAVFAASLERRGEHDRFNLAQGRLTSIAELALAVMRATGRERPLQHTAPVWARSGVSVREPTAARLRRAFPELAPFRSLEDGLTRTVAWYRDALALA